MKHFDLARWADFVRGITTADETREMSGHALVCASCRMALDLVRRIAETAAADLLFEPPAQVTRSAERIFPVIPVTEGFIRGLWSGLRRVAAELEWNSAADQLPAGVRTTHLDLQHLFYRAGRYSLDLLLDSDAAGNIVTMTGQIADDSVPPGSLEKTKAMLVSGEQVISSTTTNEFGEFSLRYEAAPNLHLVIPVERAGEYIELALEMPQVNRS
jgi:hypothetical protein